jgi:L-alanine-DL-glutamate epimerase-like enolase superfamily enzyme
MLDPACSYNTFADALKVGRACDAEGYFWYEDPFQDGGISQFAHRKLRQFIKTPILITEHVRTLEPKLDYLVADATDYLRGDPVYDGGITGTMKLAHAAEALGVDVELHVTGPDRRHCMAAMRNSNYYEMGLLHPKTALVGPPVYACDYRDGLDATDKDGCVPVPEGPGLGVEYDWDFIMKHCTGSAEYK